jgi:hypothetical protein
VEIAGEIMVGTTVGAEIAGETTTLILEVMELPNLIITQAHVDPLVEEVFRLDLQLHQVS